LAPKALQKINIRSLKELAMRKLPKESVLREVILSDKDELGVEEYLAKVDVWFKLLRREFS